MSGKHCGPSKGLLDLDAKIGEAMDDLQNGSIGTGAAGIADSISGFKDSIKSATGGILEKIEAAVPEIPEPKANLQEQMTKLMSSLDNPGLVLSEIEGIKQNFGNVVNVDEMLKNAGVDPSKIEGLSNEFNELQRRAKFQNTVGSLAKLATGDLSAVKNLMGGLPPITLPGKDPAGIIADICKDVPNLDLDADGNVIKKGVESKVATEDAEPIEKASEKKQTPAPEKNQAASDELVNSKTVVLNPNSEAAQKIEKEYTTALAVLVSFHEDIKSKQHQITTNRNRLIEIMPDLVENKKGKSYLAGLRREAKKLNDEIKSKQKEINATNFYIELYTKDKTFVKQKALFDAKAIAKGPQSVIVNWETIHEKTDFSNLTETIDLILALPNCEIKGERPARVNFDTQ